MHTFDLVFIQNIKISLISLTNKMFYILEGRRHLDQYISMLIFTCNLEQVILQIKNEGEESQYKNVINTLVNQATNVICRWGQ